MHVVDGLDGISDNLPYLKKLGVTALYLNPVFKAPSVHKYDTEDYRHVDSQFGGDGALLRLRHNTQQQGMRLVLDGVFNHSDLSVMKLLPDVRLSRPTLIIRNRSR